MSINIWKEDWLKKLALFRFDHRLFLNTYHLEEDFFVCDILKELTEDDVPAACKFQLLALLEEYAVQLFTSTSSVEQAVGSLVNIFEQTTAKSYRRQIIVTFTSLVIQFDFIQHKSIEYSRVIEVLLTVMCKANTTDHVDVRVTACTALTELETSAPGLLMNRLEYIYQLCQTENTWAHQQYTVLFVTALQHAIIQLKHSQCTSKSALSDLLCHRLEPLKPFHIPDAVCKISDSPEQQSTDRPLPSSVDRDELRRSLSYITNNLHLFNTVSAANVTQKLCTILCMVEDISPSVFKPVMLKLGPSSSVSLLHTAVLLKRAFGESLLSVQDESLLLDRVLTWMVHPVLLAGQRLLMYHWIKHWKVHSDSSVLDSSVVNKGYKLFFPGVFDGVDTQSAKLDLLCTCTREGHSDEKCRSQLLSALVNIQKRTSYGVGGKWAAALYRALYAFYSKHHSEEMNTDIKSVVIGISAKHPRLLPFAIDFLEALKSTYPDSCLPHDIMLELLDSVLSRIDFLTYTDIKYYFQLMAYAAVYPNIDPMVIIRFLLSLLSRSNLCTEGDWVLGNALIQICDRVMKHPKSKYYFREQGNVLYLLSQSYQDVDIQDRAKFYYSLLSNLSHEKTSHMLRTEETSSSSQHNIGRVAVGEGYLPNTTPVQRLEYPALALTRIPEDVTPTYKHATTPDKQLSVDELLETYLKTLCGGKMDKEIRLNYYLHYTEEGAVLGDLYAMALQIQTGRNFKRVTDIYVPSLHAEDSAFPGKDCCQVTIPLCPIFPSPVEINVRAIFNDSREKTYVANLTSLQINFEDMFVPITIKTDDRNDFSCTKDLFECLWKRFTDSCDEIRSCSHENRDNSVKTSSSESLKTNQTRKGVTFADKQQSKEELLTERRSYQEQHSLETCDIKIKCVSVPDNYTVHERDIDNHGDNDTLTNPDADGEDVPKTKTYSFLESVISVDVCEKEARKVIDSRWKHLLISDDPTYVGMYLPPSGHIMGKVLFVEDRTVFNIICSSHRLLPLFSQYIQTLFS